MRYSKMFVPTMKEEPANAKIISHRLMIRAGMIHKVASGIYTYLPFGLLVLQKISKIIRDELNGVGAQEVQMPILQPSDLWKKSNRWKDYRSELFRLKDHKKTNFCLSPTHEELVTDLVAKYINSYKQLPLNLYQIQIKFRDEIRPRYGLMRGREFSMNDAYSFSINKFGAEKIYDDMKKIYKRIFIKCGLNTVTVEADNGSIGGSKSHEFQVLTNVGEDEIAKCNACGYVANVEFGIVLPKKYEKQNFNNLKIVQEVYTPNKKTISDVSIFLGLKKSKIIKALMFMVDKKPLMVLCRGDHELSESKLKNEINSKNIYMMSEGEIEETVGPPGYIGPVGLSENIPIICDWALNGEFNLVAGSLKKNKHLLNVAVGRDFKSNFFDLKKVSINDLCGKCGDKFVIKCGIEVGHVFYLGTKYSKKMNAVAVNKYGEKCFLEMGCYGIGIGRTLAAIIEQNHDKNGIVWPMLIAPFQVSLLSLGQSKTVLNESEKLYKKLKSLGLDVLFDDRKERAGIKFKDNNLLGSPIQIIVGERNLFNGKIEFFLRNNDKIDSIKDSIDNVVLLVKDYVNRMDCCRNIEIY